MDANQGIRALALLFLETAPTSGSYPSVSSLFRDFFVSCQIESYRVGTYRFDQLLETFDRFLFFRMDASQGSAPLPPIVHETTRDGLSYQKNTSYIV